MRLRSLCKISKQKIQVVFQKELEMDFSSEF